MSKFKHELGDKAKDKVTGFEGIIVGSAAYITGCNQYCLQPQCSKANDKPKSEWFDEDRIEVVGTEKAVDPLSVQGEEKGGPYRGAPTNKIYCCCNAAVP